MFWFCSIGYSNFRSFTEWICTLWNHFRDGMPSWSHFGAYFLGNYRRTICSEQCYCAAVQVPLSTSSCASGHPTLVGKRGGRRTKYDKHLSHSRGFHIICVKQLGLELLFWTPGPPVPVTCALLSDRSMVIHLPLSDTMLQKLKIDFSDE